MCAELMDTVFLDLLPFLKYLPTALILLNSQFLSLTMHESNPILVALIASYLLKFHKVVLKIWCPLQPIIYGTRRDCCLLTPKRLALIKKIIHNSKELHQLHSHI